MSNSTFIERLRNGDRQLIEKIYTDHLDRVVKWIQENSGSKEDGYDIFQDTIEAILHRAYRDESLNDDNLRAFIFQVAKNKWIDRLRRKNTFDKVRSSFLDRLESEYNIEERFISIEKEQEKQRMLKSTFEKLSEVCKRLLTMLLKGEGTDSIVRELDMTNSNTMYRRKHACMKSWKTYIQKIKDNEAI